MHLIPQTSSSLIAWASLISKVRKFFENQGFKEVYTPYIVEVGAFESSIDPIKVSWAKGSAELHTSPEIAMKELLQILPDPIFQICRCFRDDLESKEHAKEFTMLEYYQKKTSYIDMMALTEQMVASLLPAPKTFKRISVQECFTKTLGLDLKSLKSTAQDSWEDVFFKAMIEHIEPSLDPESPTFLYDYPVQVSSLSKAKEDGFFAERFELYWKGMELCNGCTELSDSNELKKRETSQQTSRQLMNKMPHKTSEKLLEATKQIGPCAGVAVGMDRLFLAIIDEFE